MWLTKEEEQGYYYGFANEGLWPLCHIAHTRPLFRASDWKHYQEVNRKFADAVLEEMEYVREHGTSVARHVRQDIYEVRATYDTKAYRILFACEGRFHHILLSLEGFQKKTQQTPRANITLAEQRLADLRRRGKAKRAGHEK